MGQELISTAVVDKSKQDEVTLALYLLMIKLLNKRVLLDTDIEIDSIGRLLVSI